MRAEFRAAGAPSARRSLLFTAAASTSTSATTRARCAPSSTSRPWVCAYGGSTRCCRATAAATVTSAINIALGWLSSGGLGETRGEGRRNQNEG